MNNTNHALLGIYELSIQQDVFNAFLEKLTEDKDFPSGLIEEVKKLYESGEIGSEEKIHDLLNRWVTLGTKNKDD